MKTRNTIKTVVSIIIIMMINLGFGQNDYLKITRSDAKNDFIKYPPGTTFELIDESNTVVYSDKSTERAFIITKPYTLKVNPPYKEGSNSYYLKEGKVEIKSNADYFEAIEKNTKTDNYGTYTYNENDFTNGLNMKKTLEPSTVDPKKYNATFEFNNGITAVYTDGKMIAVLDGKELKVEGRYLIYSEYGLIKLSFRPSNGETWWVFEPYK